MKKMMLIGGALGILFGFIDIVIDKHFFYHNGSIWKEIFSPSPVEIYIRSSVLFMFLVFGAYAGRIMFRLEAAKSYLEKEINARKKAEIDLQFMATHDVLTGVYNRRALIDHLNQSIEQARRYESELSVLITDLDFFKKINDSFGHQEGDNVLRDFAQLLKNTVRKSDMIARYGGEEFVILAPHTTIEEATNLANKIRNLTKESLSNDKRPVTVSIGVTQWNISDGVEEIFQRTDKALYKAKDLGRDKVFSI
jgi:diguanylate cyclase (GGDEF)-like protein